MLSKKLRKNTFDLKLKLLQRPFHANDEIALMMFPASSTSACNEFSFYLSLSFSRFSQDEFSNFPRCEKLFNQPSLPERASLS